MHSLYTHTFYRITRNWHYWHFVSNSSLSLSLICVYFSLLYACDSFRQYILWISNDQFCQPMYWIRLGLWLALFFSLICLFCHVIRASWLKILLCVCVFFSLWTMTSLHSMWLSHSQFLNDKIKMYIHDLCISNVQFGCLCCVHVSSSVCYCYYWIYLECAVKWIIIICECCFWLYICVSYRIWVVKPIYRIQIQCECVLEWFMYGQ